MEKRIYEKEWKALGTDISLQLVTDGRFSQEEMELVFSEVRSIYATQEEIFSRFNPQSELSRININLGEFRDVSSDMLYLAEKSLEYFRESDGIFDPRIIGNLEAIGYVNNFKDNSFSGRVKIIEKETKRDLKKDLIIESGKIKFMCRMDFSGVAKGYITDKVVEFLREKDFKDFLIDSGGDMYACGHDGDGDAWGIALEGAKDENEVIAAISSMAIATSGNVRRNWKIGGKKFHHLVNPHQPNNFSFAVQSVTVVAETVEKADAWAKILFLLGQDKGLEKAQEENLEAYFLQIDGEVIKSDYK